MKKFFNFGEFCKLLLVFVFLLLPVINRDVAAQNGATLFLSPNSGTYTVGKSFVVTVMVNSGAGSGINAAEGKIKYDTNFLTVSKLSNTGTIFKLWTTEPTYSNSNGTIDFGGGTPGSYTGSGGKIFSITFTPRAEGATKVSFLSGQVLANDGKGTDILSGFGQANFTIVSKPATEEKKISKKPKPKKEEKKQETGGLLPPLPEVSSPSHPEENIWYANNQPEFTWKILADLTGVSYNLSRKEIDDPGNLTDGIVESNKFDPVDDGEWYFHIKYQNRFGWGQIAKRKVLIDATPPAPFAVVVDNGGDPTNPTPKLRFEANDKTSGIDHIVVKIGPESFKLDNKEISNNFYQTSPLPPGETAASVVIFDKAGNSASSSVKFVIEPLKSPIITAIPQLINRKDELIIRGTSFYPQVTIKIYIAKNDNDILEFSTKADDEGNWSYFYNDNLEKGNYEVWAKIVDDRGAESLNSTKHLLQVVSPSIVVAYGFWIILILVFIIVFLAAYIYYQRRKYLAEKYRILRETKEVKVKLSKIFYALREEVNELIELADKKPGLSESERRVKEKLQESLDISEEFIGKEVEDVEKEINLPKIEEKKIKTLINKNINQ